MFAGISLPYALGTETIPRVRTDSLRDLLLLPSPLLVQHRHPQASFRSRAGAGAPPPRPLCLWLCCTCRGLGVEQLPPVCDWLQQAEWRLNASGLRGSENGWEGDF